MRPAPTTRLRAGLRLASWLVGLALVPALLTHLGGLPSPGGIRAAVDLRYLPPRLVLQVAAATGWVAYAYVLVRAGVEAAFAVAQRPVTRATPRRLPPVTAHLAALAVICLGRLATPASAAAPAPAPVLAAAAAVAPDPASHNEAAASAPQHLVVPGDNLWDLSDEYYGRGEDWPRIWEANRSTVPDPYDLLVGVVLSIPQAMAADRTYTVRPGDSLWSIAEEELGSGPAWTELWDANQQRAEPGGQSLLDPSLIQPGWELQLPARDATPAPPGAGTGISTTAPAPPPLGASPTPPAPPSMAPAATDAPAPGGPVGSPGSTPAPSGAASHHRAPPLSETSAPTSPMGEALGAAGTVLAVGLAGAVWRRRRRRELCDGPRARRVRPPVEHHALRAEIAYDADADHVGLLTGALHQVGAHLARRGAPEQVRVVQVGADQVEVALNRPLLPTPPGWRPVASGSVWVLDDAHSTPAGGVACPCPALVSIGAAEAGRQLYMDLEAEGLVSLVGDDQAVRDLARSWVVELSASPMSAGASVLVVGEAILEPSDAWDRVRFTPDWAAVAGEVAERIEQSTSMLAARRWPSPAAGRSSSTAPVDLDCLVVMTAGAPTDPRFAEACRRIGSGPAAVAFVVVGDDVAGATKVQADGDHLIVPSLGLACRAQAIGAETAAAIHALLEDAAAPLAEDEPPAEEATRRPVAAERVLADPYRDPEHDVLVRLLGEIAVIGGSKPLTPQQTAVVAYIALHGLVTPDAIEDAIWVAPTENRRRRLANTISDCRTALGASHLPMASDGHYRLGPGVMTDTDLFQRRVDYAQHQAGAAAVETLRGALELVSGPVFSYRNAERHSYVWVDLESWHSDWEHRVVNLVSDLGRRYLELGDTAGAIWAGEQGRRASKTAPEPRRVLMEAHLAAGTPDAAIREFEAYKSGLEALDFDEVDSDLVVLYKEAKEVRPGASDGPA